MNRYCYYNDAWDCVEFRKLNRPNWLFNDKTREHQSQRSHCVDVDIVVCSIGGWRHYPSFISETQSQGRVVVWHAPQVV